MTSEDVLFGAHPHYCFFTLRSSLIAILPLSTQHRLHARLLQFYLFISVSAFAIGFVICCLIVHNL